MVCDVGGEVGELAVAFDDRAVFVVAELRRFIPFGAVLRIEQAARAQFDPSRARLRRARASPFH